LTTIDPTRVQTVQTQLQQWAIDLGFSAVGIADTQLSKHREQIQQWLDDELHGDMNYMATSIEQRLAPSLLVPGATRAIMVTMPYLPNDANWIKTAWDNLGNTDRAYVSRYALGRDYHKVVRSRLQKLATQIELAVGPFGYRVFCDSAPVMEVALAAKAGIGWRGKHTLLLSREQGSGFFLGSILTNLPLTVDESVTEHCGSCSACIDICPTQAITKPYWLDARRCISYLTIEHHGSIDLQLRPLMGNRILGCDDCQLVCPWNKFAQKMTLPDFAARHGLDNSSLVSLFEWTAQQFDERTQGSAIRRIGHERWLRNIAIALGNCKTEPAEHLTRALNTHVNHSSEMVREHVLWALEQQAQRGSEFALPA
jgi:epoxyqueuosine reductase